MAGRGYPHRVEPHLRRARAGARVRRAPSRAAGGEGVRPGGRERARSSARRARRRPPPLRAMLGDGSLRRRGPHRRDRVVPAGRRGLRPRDHRRHRRRAAAGLPGPQAPAGGQTPGPTPAGWARTARCRWRRRSCSSARGARCSCPRWREMRRRGTPFTGVLYAGLMVDDDGTPWVVEFNCRLGDPETQVVLPLVSGGLTRLALACRDGRARRRRSTCCPAAASVTTVLASRGYPDAPEKGAADPHPRQLARGRDGLPRGNRRAARTACSG